MSVQTLRPNLTTPFLRLADYAALTDAELIAACQDRKPIAFECLRQRYLGLVHSMLHRLAPGRTDHDDLTQEVFLRVWLSIKTLREPAAFRGWLNRIVSNSFYNEFRRKPDKTLVYLDCPLSNDSGSENSFTQIADPASRPDEVAQTSELTEEIRSSLGSMQPEKRMLILLRMDGLSYGQIATATNTELGTVKSRLSRARCKLKSLLYPAEKQTIVPFKPTLVA
jgi:RNA polymerase sigma-70 factor (ECF subfamily)